MYAIIKQVISQKTYKMKIAIIGYGRMGHEIEAIAKSRGHIIDLIIDQDNESDLNPARLKGVDVAIEFTTPSSALTNISKCLTASVPVVSGTTGWLDDYKIAADLCIKHDTSFIHSTNYSIGVNLLFRLNAELATLIKRYSEYSVSIEEIHHTKKLDAPSGTAISLANGIIASDPEYRKWHNDAHKEAGSLPIVSVREDMVPGTHTVLWDSEIDSISLRHEAKNRKGLALGAVVAAEYIYNRKGVFTMNDVMSI